MNFQPTKAALRSAFFVALFITASSNKPEAGTNEIIVDFVEAPTIDKFISNDFAEVQIAFLGRVTDVIQSGTYIGPPTRDFNTEPYYRLGYSYRLYAVKVDKILKGANYLNPERDQISLAITHICNGCKVNKVDSTHTQSTESLQLFLVCKSANHSSFDRNVRRYLATQLRHYKHSADFVETGRCSFRGADEPSTISKVEDYFGIQTNP